MLGKIVTIGCGGAVFRVRVDRNLDSFIYGKVVQSSLGDPAPVGAEITISVTQIDWVIGAWTFPAPPAGWGG